MILNWILDKVLSQKKHEIITAPDYSKLKGVDEVEEIIVDEGAKPTMERSARMSRR